LISWAQAKSYLSPNDFITVANAPALRLGTRASALARWQADWTAQRLRALGVEVELVLIRTSGDQQQSGPIGAIGTQGVFTKELERALLEKQIDLAVHSLKDLPTELPAGLRLGAIPERAPIGDCLVATSYRGFNDLPEKARIGTGSARRRAQLLHARRDLQMLDIRGNVETRLRKLEEGEYDAIILAEAGLRRLGLEAHITEVLPLSLILPAVGQGALGLEVRADDDLTVSLVAQLNHPPTEAAVVAERAMLAALHGGCLAPVAAWGRLESDALLHLTGVVVSVDGVQRLETAISGDPRDAESLGQFAATELLSKGAEPLIAHSRSK
jgi:hydroxymethylbilane synthase